MAKQVDYLIVGSGLFGAVFAQQARQAGKRCLVLEKRDHIAGNVYTKQIEGINTHQYGAHIFHTNDQSVWKYLCQFTSFLPFVNSPIANYQGKLYNLPFNMHTFHQMWGVITPAQAKEVLVRERALCYIEHPTNLEQMALNLVGRDIYEKLIRGYTQKQWGRRCDELPPDILTRLPVRFTYDNNYFDAYYQGIPKDGYTAMVQNMLEGIEVRLLCDYFSNKASYDTLASTVVYTGPIDEYFSFCYGALHYRSVRFEHSVLSIENFQGNAVVNYTDIKVPYTRIIEHKHFDRMAIEKKLQKTVVSYEYSHEWRVGEQPYYPVRDEQNLEKLQKYQQLAKQLPNTIFGGRLGSYSYYDMDVVVAKALACFSKSN